MSDCNVGMHTCEIENGRTRIDFCYNSNWTPNRFITWVYFKCLLWLNIYDLHLQTGEMMSVYIAHQQTSFPYGFYGNFPLEIDESELIVKSKETKKLDDLNIEMEYVNLQNICNIIRVAQYGSLDEMRYTLVDIHKGVLKPVLLEQKTHLDMGLRDAYA